MERRSPDRHRSPQKQRDGSHLRVSPRGTMTRRQGNADLWSAQPRAARRARRTSNSGMAPVSAYPQEARRRAGKGTPTSGRHSRAQRGGRDEPQTAGWLPSPRIPKRHAAGETNLNAQARERRPLVGTAARSAAGETNLKRRDGSRLGVSPPGTATRRQGNADLWSAQPRAARRARRTSNSGMAPVSAYPQGHDDAQARERRPLVGTAARSAAGETNLKQRDGSHLRVSPRGTMTRRQGNADLWSAQPRVARRARRTSNSGMVRTCNAYFSRSGGAGAGHPASRQYVVRPPPAGGADRRSAFPCLPDHPASRQYVVRPPPAGGADRRSAFPCLPDHPASRQYVVRPPPAGGAGRPTGSSAVRVRPGRRSAFPGLSDHPAGRQYVVRPPPAGGADRRSAFPGLPDHPAGRQYVVRPPPAGGADRRSAFPLPPGSSRQSAVRGSARLRRAVPTGGRRSRASRSIPPVGSTWFARLRRAVPGGRRSLASRIIPPVGSTWFARLRRAVPTGGRRSCSSLYAAARTRMAPPGRESGRPRRLLPEYMAVYCQLWPP